MTKKMIPYEIGKILIVLWCLVSAAFIAYGAYQILSNLMQLGFSLIPKDIWKTVFEEPSSEKVQPIIDLIKGFNKGLTSEEAKSKLIGAALLLAVGIVSMIFARDQLHRQERRFKKKFLPAVLEEQFSDVVYEPKKARSEDEPLCRMGLLRCYERYYTANRLEALYRDCWVASEEVICGGVYGKRYTSRKVKVRGQWMTVRLSQPIDSLVVLENRHTKNRLTHSKIAATMTEVNFSYDDFMEEFRCFAEDPTLAQMLITRSVADKFLSILEKYNDFCVIFDGSDMHVLLRRKSFDRRLECLLPYSDWLLHREATRLYQPLQDFTDLLLE